MDAKNKVFRYISDFSEIPLDQLNEETDVVADIDWENRHEDERFEIFIDEFIEKFNVLPSWQQRILPHFERMILSIPCFEQSAPNQ